MCVFVFTLEGVAENCCTLTIELIVTLQSLGGRLSKCVIMGTSSSTTVTHTVQSKLP